MTGGENPYHLPYVESNHQYKYNSPNLTAKGMVDRTYFFFFVMLGILLQAFANIILIQGPEAPPDFQRSHGIFSKNPREAMPGSSWPMLQA